MENSSNPLDEMHLRFRQLRRDSGLGQKEFAESIGLKQSNYGSFEIGKSKITVQTLTITIAVYSVDPYWLLFGDVLCTAMRESKRYPVSRMIEEIKDAKKRLMNALDQHKLKKD